MTFPLDQFTRKLVVIGALVIAASVGGSVALTNSLTAALDAEWRWYAMRIALTVPLTVAPLMVCAFGWLAVINNRLLIQVDHMARHDDLTGLINRRAFLDQASARMAASGQGRIALALADLDHFKHVNDSFGHAAGDAALRHVAERLSASAPAGSLVARLGGEEFVILFEWRDPTDVQAVVARLCENVSASPFAFEGGAQVVMTVSIGVAIADGGEDIDALLRRADAAMYGAKHGGRNQIKLAA